MTNLTVMEAWPLAARINAAIGAAPNIWLAIVSEPKRVAEARKALIVELNSLRDEGARCISPKAVGEFIDEAEDSDDLLIVEICARWAENDWRTLDVCRSRMMRQGMTVLIMGHDNAIQMSVEAPGIMSWIGGSVFFLHV